ncbi:hypothetical protein H0H92_008163, partial [Tricholoma furcatifolium]
MPETLQHENMNGKPSEGRYLEFELFWVKYQPFLLSKGYKLRPRYDPNWVPSWGEGDTPPIDEPGYEDALVNHKVIHVLDAVCLTDDRKVVFKKVKSPSEELSIAQYLNSEPRLSDPRNHSVPVLEILHLPDDDTLVLLVMPHLVDMDFLPFRYVGEFAEAVRQYLE